ncbi:MAG: pseudouridine synthase [Gemmatimonadota bacterium]
MAGPVRLQKFLSQAGVASRRASEDIIQAGRVSVNGTVVTELGTKVDPAGDAVMVDGKLVEPAARRWVALHKPIGYVTTRADPEGRRTVYELLPEELHGLFYVGRLDYDSEGLLLLTNDGDAAHRLLHPSYGAERVYEALVEGRPDESVMRRLVEGVQLEDGLAVARAAERGERTPGGVMVRITLAEGRKREVRRMLDAVGHPVKRLRRVRYGPISLGDLPSGGWRELTRKELSALARVARRKPRPRGGKARRERQGGVGRDAGGRGRQS